MSQIFDSFIDFLQKILPEPPEGLEIVSDAACNWCHMCDKPGGLCVLWWIVFLLLALFLLTSLFGRGKKCPHCKAKNKAKAMVCKKCGKPLTEEETKETETAEAAAQQAYAPAPGMDYVPQQPYAPAPGMEYAPQQAYAPAPGMEYAPQQPYAPAPGMDYVPQQAYAPAPGMEYAPQQPYAPAPGMDYVPQQAYAPAPGMGYPSMQQNREAALQKLLQQDPSLIHDPAISLLLQQSQSAPGSMPASISSTAQNGPWQQSPQGGELAALRASIKYCPVCGSALPWEAVFCGTCGTHLN